MKKIYILVVSMLLQICYFSTECMAANVYEGAVKFGNNYYKIFDTSVTWDNAKKACENMKGHLATIESENEQRFIEQLVRNKGTRNCYWLGGYRASNGSWRWVTNKGLSYTNWANGQPDNWTRREDKLMLYRIPNPLNPSPVGKWNDAQADGECNGESFFGKRNFGYVCEWENSIEDDATLTSRTITLGNFSTLDEWRKQMKIAESSAIGFSARRIYDQEKGSFTIDEGQMIVGISVLSYQNIRVLNPKAMGPAYSRNDYITLSVPKKVKFVLHKHRYNSNVFCDFTTLSNTLKCSCGKSYKYGWEIPWPDIQGDRKAVKKIIYRELPVGR